MLVVRHSVRFGTALFKSSNFETRCYTTYIWAHLEKAPLDGNHATAAAYDAVRSRHCCVPSLFLLNFYLLLRIPHP